MAALHTVGAGHCFENDIAREDFGQRHLVPVLAINVHCFNVSYYLPFFAASFDHRVQLQLTFFPAEIVRVGHQLLAALHTHDAIGRRLKRSRVWGLTAPLVEELVDLRQQLILDLGTPSVFFPQVHEEGMLVHLWHF